MSGSSRCSTARDDTATGGDGAALDRFAQALEHWDPAPPGTTQDREHALDEAAPAVLDHRAQYRERHLQAVERVLEPTVDLVIAHLVDTREVAEAAAHVGSTHQPGELERVEVRVGDLASERGGQELALEAGVVGEDRRVTEEGQQLGGDLIEGRRGCDHRLVDPGQARDRSRDREPRLHQRAIGPGDLAVDTLDRADVHDPVPARAEPRGLEVEGHVPPGQERARER
ncbi:MAG: hypothetical protein IPK07_01850 [Deltaproteobacteria bacterium]|nr:hypothetical protein [Deltaproteobacteria bacterium]